MCTSSTEEPAIVGFGRHHVKDYPEVDLRAALVRAFKDGRASSIVLDSCMSGQKFRAAGVAWAIDQGLIYNDHNSVGSQETVSSFRLTEKGRKEILG